MEKICTNSEKSRHRLLPRSGKGLKMLLLLSLGLIWTVSMSAQGQSLRGRVVDENGAPIVGAAVVVVGQASGTTTGADGSFTLNVASGSTIEVSFLGYEAQRRRINTYDPVVIVLEEQTRSIDNIVVVGYGTQRKETLSGAVGNIRADEIMTTKATAVSQMVQGKMAGLRVKTKEGEPGNFNTDIRIRGADGDPIFVIDGVVRGGRDEFERLNAEDIESMSFLKDASALIYGMNSGNGAIIVTTKKGYVGEAKIKFDANVGFANPTNMPRLLNSGEYYTLYNEATINSTGSPLLSKEELAKWVEGGPGYESYDYWDLITKKVSTVWQGTISISGGNENVNYYTSLGYMKDNGLMKFNAFEYEKYTFRSNIDMKISKNLRGIINISGRLDRKDHPWESYFGQLFNTAVNPPHEPLFANNNPDYPNKLTNANGNPIVGLDKEKSGYRREKRRNIITNFALEYDAPFLEGLKARAGIGYDFNGYNSKNLGKTVNYYSYSKDTDVYTAFPYHGPSQLDMHNNNGNRFDFQFQLNYDRVFASDHAVNATFVYEAKRNWASWFGGSRFFDTVLIDELDYGLNSDQNSNGKSNEEKFLSYIGRVNYGYKGKYLAEFAIRYDGSYKYASGSRWALFPTASIAWRISEESFVKNNLNWMDNLKIRASVGKSGQDAADAYQDLPLYKLNERGYEFSNGNFTLGAKSPAMVNPNLTWVDVTMYNIGVDYSMFNRKFTLEFDIYQKNRSGFLAKRDVSLPNYYGAEMPQENLNSDRYRGFEFTAGHYNRIADFHYGISANFGFTRRKRMYEEERNFNSSWDRWRNQSSYRYDNYIWGYKTVGRFTSFDEIGTWAVQRNESWGSSREIMGDYMIYDRNGDGVINDNDKVPYFWGDTPLASYGMTIEMEWKNFDFTALFQGSGFYTMQIGFVYGTPLSHGGGNSAAYFMDRWHQVDPYDPYSEWIPGKYPATKLDSDRGSRDLDDLDSRRKNATYLRLTTLELGYTFRQQFLSKAGIERMRLYVNGNNLYTFCNSYLKPFDPEKVTGHYSGGMTYPLTKSFNVGISITF